MTRISHKRPTSANRPEIGGRLRALPVSQFGEECYVATGGQRIRVNVRWGTGCAAGVVHGIGASLEVLDPLVEQLDSDTTVGQVRCARNRRIAHIPCTLWVPVPCLGARPGTVRAGNRRGGRGSGCPGAGRLRNSSPFKTLAGAAA